MAGGGKNLMTGQSIPDVFAVIASGVAYFDGVRHLWMSYNKDEGANGYLYYPDIKGLIAIMQKLKELELKYCIRSEVRD